MIEFTIHQLFPDFILADQNGYAMAKAIERALQIMCDTIQTGIDNLQNIEKMPEWRLDELSWEYNCLYDHNADIEAKRHWIRDATSLFSIYGTASAICSFLEGVFEEVDVEEGQEYGGEPFHFRVIVSGDWVNASKEWTYQVISFVKSLRSILDKVDFSGRQRVQIRCSGEVIAYAPHRMMGISPDIAANSQLGIGLLEHITLEG